jgi:hypothetical protein
MGYFLGYLNVEQSKQRKHFNYWQMPPAESNLGNERELLRVGISRWAHLFSSRPYPSCQALWVSGGLRAASL